MKLFFSKVNVARDLPDSNWSTTFHWGEIFEAKPLRIKNFFFLWNDPIIHQSWKKSLFCHGFNKMSVLEATNFLYFDEKGSKEIGFLEK